MLENHVWAYTKRDEIKCDIILGHLFCHMIFFIDFRIQKNSHTARILFFEQSDDFLIFCKLASLTFSKMGEGEIILLLNF